MRIKIPLAVLLLAAGIMVILPAIGNRTHYDISGGFYRMETETSGAVPYIHFDMGNDKTTFVLGIENISYSCHGTVELNGEVNLLAASGEKWVFEIIDNDTLKYDAEKSRTESFAFPDDTIFLYADKR